MQTTRLALLITIAASAALSGGCDTTEKTTRIDDPIERMLDPREETPVRWKAARQAEREMFDSPDRVAALRELVWRRGTYSEMSTYAVDQLVKINESEARDYLSESVVLIRDWDVLKHVFNTAVARKWTDFVPALVRNYALRTPVYRDHERPERKAIAALRPDKSVEEVVIEVLADDAGADIKERAAAWQLMYRLTDGDRQKMVALLKGIDARDPLLIDLKAAASDLNVVPTNMEEITWIQLLRTDLYGRYWDRARGVVSQLTAEQRRDLQPRHLPVLIYLQSQRPEMLRKSRASLLASLTAFVNSQKHYLHGPTYDGPMDKHPQRLYTWQDKLAWADLAATHIVMEIMRDPAARQTFFAEAEADNKDKSTEYGGLVRISESGKPYVHPYKPMMRRHDMIYFPPKQMVFDAYDGLLHYHFHAQDHDNREWAGPGMGDQKRIAQRQRFNAIVLTFIDRDTLNVDYYQPEEVVIDMGVITR